MAWMTSNFFAIWANQINKNKWEKKEESLFFFIDSFQAHCITPEIKNSKNSFPPIKYNFRVANFRLQVSQKFQTGI